MVHAISLFAVLYGTWLLLSGIFEPFLLIAGAVCAAIVVVIAIRMDGVDHEGHPVHLTWRALAYWPWLGWQVILSAVDVTRIILSPRPAIDPVLRWVPASQKTDVGRVAYANSITLTPGTVSTDVRKGGIEVHALTRQAMAELLEGEMDRRVTGMEGRGETSS